MVSTEDLVLFRAQARLILGLVAIAWVIHFVNVMLGYGLNYWFGLRPRNPWGLIGVVCAHFLHSSWKHLIGNTKAFLLLGWFIAAQGIHLFYAVTIIIALLGGFLAWLVYAPDPSDKSDQRPGVGASILVYGYIGFLLVYGLVSGDAIALLLASITAITRRYNIFGWINRLGFWQLGWLSSGDRRLDRHKDVRNGGWYGHFGGLIAGVFTGYLMAVMKLSV
jgi:membrane associated rhomboid family serine protease